VRKTARLPALAALASMCCAQAPAAAVALERGAATMALDEPFPSLDELLGTIGEAGARVSSIEASEGAAGNISICEGWPMEVRRRFPQASPFTLPQPAPADRIEYAETAALYEYMDLVNGGRGEGLTLDELREIVRAFNVQTTLLDRL
jgi:hypothetical protein